MSKPKRKGLKNERTRVKPTPTESPTKSKLSWPVLGSTAILDSVLGPAFNYPDPNCTKFWKN